MNKITFFALASALSLPIGLASSPSYDYTKIGSDYRTQLERVMAKEKYITAAITNKSYTLDKKGLLNESSQAVRNLKFLKKLTGSLLNKSNRDIGFQVTSNLTKNTKCSTSVEVSVSVEHHIHSCARSFVLESFELNGEYQDIFQVSSYDRGRTHQYSSYVSGELKKLDSYLSKLTAKIHNSQITIQAHNKTTICASGKKCYTRYNAI